jgi:hypothetical protein
MWCHGLFLRQRLFARGKILYEGVSKSFRTESITKYILSTINTRWEATQRVMAAKLVRLTHKISIQLHLVAESLTFAVLAPGGQSEIFWIQPRIMVSCGNDVWLAAAVIEVFQDLIKLIWVGFRLIMQKIHRWTWFANLSNQWAWRIFWFKKIG